MHTKTEGDLMRYGLLILLMAAAASAGPTTRPKDVAPKDPPPVSFVGQVYDTSRLAYVPAFTARQGPPAWQAGRENAVRLSPPVHGYPVYSFPACGYGYWGSCGGGGWYPNHGFYR
jgi:hypothetical protein